MLQPTRCRHRAQLMWLTLQALYDGLLLDYPLAHIFVRILQGHRPLFDELATLDSDLHRNLSQLKQVIGDSLSVHRSAQAGVELELDANALIRRPPKVHWHASTCLTARVIHQRHWLDVGRHTAPCANPIPDA